MIRTPIVLGFIFSLVLLGSLGVAVAAPVVASAPTIQATTSPAGPALSADPFFGAAEITTQTAVVRYCRCAIGVNCCGDIANGCSITDKKGNGTCRCTSAGCVH